MAFIGDGGTGKKPHLCILKHLNSRGHQLVLFCFFQESDALPLEMPVPFDDEKLIKIEYGEKDDVHVKDNLNDDTNFEDTLDHCLSKVKTEEAITSKISPIKYVKANNESYDIKEIIKPIPKKQYNGKKKNKKHLKGPFVCDKCGKSYSRYL